jgi:hypothetical protein
MIPVIAIEIPLQSPHLRDNGKFALEIDLGNVVGKLQIIIPIIIHGYVTFNHYLTKAVVVKDLSEGITSSNQPVGVIYAVARLPRF